MSETTGNYVFPKKAGNVMSKISPQTTYEAGMLSLVFIMFGLVAVSVYMIFFSSTTLFMKIMIPFNALCGIVLMLSYLVTTFQQYQSYLMAMGIIFSEEEDETKEI